MKKILFFLFLILILLVACLGGYKNEQEKFESDKQMLEKLVRMLNRDNFIYLVAKTGNYEFAINSSNLKFKNANDLYKNKNEILTIYGRYIIKNNKITDKLEMSKITKKRFLDYVKIFNMINLEEIDIDENTIIFTYKKGFMFAYIKKKIKNKRISIGYINGWSRYIDKKVEENWYTVK